MGAIDVARERKLDTSEAAPDPESQRLAEVQVRLGGVRTPRLTYLRLEPERVHEPGQSLGFTCKPTDTNNSHNKRNSHEKRSIHEKCKPMQLL